MARLGELIGKEQPCVIAVGCQSREALALADELRQMIKRLAEREPHFRPMDVVLVDTNLATVFANCSRAENEFPAQHYPHHFRQAVSLARRLQVSFDASQYYP